jgi:nitrogen regulatory protein PII-like uncharacterized protein
LSTSSAVTQATRLSEIGFPEFTAKLITDTFDALIAANIRQTEAYTALVKATAQDLTTYINETKDDISGDMVLQYLTNVLTPEQFTKVDKKTTLDADTAKAITDACEIDGQAKTTIAAGAVTQTVFNSILEAAAKRIAADKYTVLREMVKMGILRLIVETGVIETKLTFSTFNSSYYNSNSSRYNSSSFSAKASASTGKFVSLWCKASASTAYNTLSVSTANSSSSSSSGTNVQIYGLVRINFKTDYQPLSTT